MKLTIPLVPVPKGRSRVWSNEEVKWLKTYYPNKGKMFCARCLGREEGSVRWKASDLGLKENPNGESRKKWIERVKCSARARKGQKRPAQAEVMRNNHRQGKMKQTPEMRKRIGEATKKRLREKGHPKGMLGKHHSEKTKARLRETSKMTWDRMTEEEKRKHILKQLKGKDGRPPNKPHGSWKAGWREFGGKRCYYRSRWEANFGRYLQMLKEQGQIKDWMHEPKAFWFDKIKRGVLSYLPDFLVIENDDTEIYYEVKGWMDDRSKTKLQRMKKYYPDVTLRLVDAKSYRRLAARVKALIPEWESERGSSWK